MAGIAIVGGIGMISRFTLRDAVIVTAGTGADDMAMINICRLYRCPRYRTRLMTGITGIGAINMVARFT